jgi:hypothetical protein
LWYFQAELLNSGFDCQKQMLTGHDQRISCQRQADKKRLTRGYSAEDRSPATGFRGVCCRTVKALHELPDKVTQELRSHFGAYPSGDWQSDRLRRPAVQGGESLHSRRHSQPLVFPVSNTFLFNVLKLLSRK